MAGRGGSTGRGGRRSPGGRDRGSAGCLLWLIVFSFIFLLFVLNWGKIKETLDQTNFNEIVKNQRTTEPPAHVAPSVPAARPPKPAQPGGDLSPPEKSAPTGSATGGSLPPQSPDVAKPVTAPSSVSEAEKALSAAQPTRPRAATLYFIRIDDDGVISRQDVRRMIPASDTPLSDALGAVIAGPDESELRQHLVSLIPSGTKLLGVRVQGTTAIVDLSEPFMYNHYGIEGYAGQLKQIVYTATSFPTVHDVQILIDGQRHDYLGGEGVYIGGPLSRNSF